MAEVLKAQEKTDKIQVTIRDKRFPKWVRMVIANTLYVIVPIGIGILTGSRAMEWVGFIMALLGIGASIHVEVKKTTFTTINEAIEYLKSIETQD